MKSAISSSSWISRTHRDSPSIPLNPSPRPPHPQPLSLGSGTVSKSSLKAFFRPKPTSRDPSFHSDPPSPADTHPYATMHISPIPVVSSHDVADIDDDCPVCLEPLSFSFRLPGEKPHIVPECGHALHEVRLFTAVYGPPPNQARSTVPRKSNLGVCGVCRRPMKVGDGDGGKSNKLAALTGMGDHKDAPLYPGRDTPTGRKRAHSQPYSPNDDDPIDHAGSVKSSPTTEHSQYIVAPSIQVRPEFSSLTRTNDVNQPLTCIVVIELPGKRPNTTVPGPVMSENYGLRNGHLRSEPTSRHASPRPDHPRQHQPAEPDVSARLYRNRSPDTNFAPSSNGHESQFDFKQEEESPFNAITEDLRNRIIDWKGHPLSDLGPLQMYDLLSVRRDAAIREFFVYLFKEAIICVVEEKKRGLGRLLSNASALTDHSSITSGSGQSKGVLRLKGRIYVRHIKHVTASSAAGEMSLTIDMEDELASFILIFKDRASLESWKNNIQSLVNMFQHQNGIVHPQAEPARPPDMEEFGGNAKVMRMLSGSTGTTSSAADSLLNGSSRSTIGTAMHQKLSPLGEDDELSNYEASPPLVTPYTSAGPSNSLTPLPHPPIDLILVISIPPPSAAPSTAQLKVRVIRATLDFIIASLAARDRLSLVTFEVGTGGRVRKTPFLSCGKAQSRGRLEKFVDEMGVQLEDGQDEFLVRVSKEEKTDVVTAVNHGLDIVLQRKARNPISGMMDLVLARAEALIGTYTFVKDWYDLRDCIAGCVGGMMSIGLLNMKLHMKIVDGQRFRIRKVSGGPSSILASDGQNVDVDVGELRYGERKEMLIELELDNTDSRRLAQQHRQHQQHPQHGRSLNATDQFVQSMGLGSLAIDDSPDFADGMMDRMIDEVPVVEVDGAFFDPAASKNVSRLAHPVLLTVTLLPASSASPRQPSVVSDPIIVRRRMELLASDMITRALVLVSRRNFPQAQNILGETKRILHTVLQTISRGLPPPNANGGNARNRKEIMTLSAVRAMQAVLQDLQILSEALEENVDLFAHDQRNFGAQQAMILRDQKSWSGRSATERIFWTTDNSIELVSRSNDWVARE
ncbi:Pleckstrin homology domain-containing protein [Infundibulicybe gibba]|nr:Pleckstrin homology domain-containing protein [Infundibulicybe gibba]